MQTFAIRIISSLLAFVLSSCTAVGPAFERRPLIDRDYGYVYVFRPGSTTAGGMGVVPDVYIDGRRIAGLKDGGYIVARLKAGEHLVELDVASATRRIRRTVDVQGMDEFFFRLTVDTSSVRLPQYTVATEMLRVKPMHALDEIVDARRVAEISSFDSTLPSVSGTKGP